jgi:predicted RNA-binding protein YlqC (UPF0109 family)
MIEIIARTLVHEPELVAVCAVGGRHTSILKLTVAKADIGKVAGKQGGTADTLRILLSAVSAKAKKRIMFEIVG